MSLNKIEKAQGIRVRSTQDLAAGVFMMLLAGLALVLSSDRPIGTLSMIGLMLHGAMGGLGAEYRTPGAGSLPGPPGLYNGVYGSVDGISTVVILATAAWSPSRTMSM